MFTNTIYESLKQELDKYLFGFEKSQLETSLLSGNTPHSGQVTLCSGQINLKSVNVKPDCATELLQSLGFPFQLKAGTIANLQIQFSYLQMFGSNPIQVNISELFVILGPDLLHRSSD